MAKQSAVVKAIHARIAQIDREREALEQEQASLEKVLGYQTKPKERKKRGQPPTLVTNSQL